MTGGTLRLRAMPRLNENEEESYLSPEPCLGYGNNYIPSSELSTTLRSDGNCSACRCWNLISQFLQLDFSTKSGALKDLTNFCGSEIRSQSFTRTQVDLTLLTY